MSRNLEAFYLPLLFLTVALFGGVRVARQITRQTPQPGAVGQQLARLRVVLQRAHRQGETERGRT